MVTETTLHSFISNATRRALGVFGPVAFPSLYLPYLWPGPCRCLGAHAIVQVVPILTQVSDLLVITTWYMAPNSSHSIAASNSIAAVFEGLRLRQASAIPAQSLNLLREESCNLRRATKAAAKPACSSSSSHPTNSTAPPLINGFNVSRCWFANIHPCGEYRPHQLSVGDALLVGYSGFRFDTTAPRESHLLEALRGMRRPLITFYGDSTLDGLAQAARCEAMRALLDTPLLDVTSAIHDVSILAAVTARIRYVKMGPRRFLAADLDRVATEMEHKGGLLVYSSGVHYNNAQDMSGPGGVIEMRGTYSRGEHAQDLQVALTRLSKMGERCSSSGSGSGSWCAAVYMTPPTQHFPSEYGHFDRVAGNLSRLPAHTYGCAPLRGQPNASAAGAFDLAAHSPNAWRATDAIQMLRKLAPHVAVIPVHLVSRLWWAAHPGSSSLTWRSAPKKGAKILLDCTHLCYSPILYEPVWWALLRATRSRHHPWGGS